MTPREYRTGSLYRRGSDGMWIGTIEAGYTATGARKRVTVSAKTEKAARRKLRDKRLALERGETATGRATVRTWADEWLAIKVRELSPKGYNAASSVVRKWIVPTIGHRRLNELTRADVRNVAEAQRKAGRKPADTHRTLLNMLRAAVDEGHHVPTPVLRTKAPKGDASDRAGMTVPEGLACLEVASHLPHGTRWLVTLLYGMRQGECLGLTWDAVDFDAGEYGEIVIEWQLQALPYVNRADKAAGFRVPDGYESRHLVDAWHLVRPKSRQGYRVAPMLPAVRAGLLAWRDIAPANPHNLVWPTAKGRPANNKHDLTEWHAIQGTAGVGHPGGRYYHVHECRNYAATMLLEAGVDAHIITTLLGHSSIATSRGYMTVRREPLQEALTRVGQRLQLG